MRKAIILAAGLALVTTSALGQGSWRDRDDDDRRGWREDRREGRDRDEMRGRSMRDHHDDDEGRSRAARFVLRSGEARMAVRCDDREFDARLRRCGHDLVRQGADPAGRELDLIHEPGLVIERPAPGPVAPEATSSRIRIFADAGVDEPSGSRRSDGRDQSSQTRERRMITSPSRSMMRRLT